MRVAGGLWVAHGVTLVVLGSALLLQMLAYGSLVQIAITAPLPLAGVYTWRRGRWLRAGVDVRAGLLRVGIATCLVLWPALLVVPAAVLQSRRDGDEWFRGRIG